MISFRMISKRSLNRVMHHAVCLYRYIMEIMFCISVYIYCIVWQIILAYTCKLHMLRMSNFPSFAQILSIIERTLKANLPVGVRGSMLTPHGRIGCPERNIYVPEIPIFCAIESLPNLQSECKTVREALMKITGVEPTQAELIAMRETLFEGVLPRMTRSEKRKRSTNLEIMEKHCDILLPLLSCPEYITKIINITLEFRNSSKRDQETILMNLFLKKK